MLQAILAQITDATGIYKDSDTDTIAHFEIKHLVSHGLDQTSNLMSYRQWRTLYTPFAIDRMEI
jgi:hypothetical protein